MDVSRNVPCLQSLIQGRSVRISLHEDFSGVHMLHCQHTPVNVSVDGTDDVWRWGIAIKCTSKEVCGLPVL